MRTGAPLRGCSKFFNHFVTTSVTSSIKVLNAIKKAARHLGIPKIISSRPPHLVWTSWKFLKNNNFVHMRVAQSFYFSKQVAHLSFETGKNMQQNAIKENILVTCCLAAWLLQILETFCHQVCHHLTIKGLKVIKRGDLQNSHLSISATYLVLVWWWRCLNLIRRTFFPLK